MAVDPCRGTRIAPIVHVKWFLRSVLRNSRVVVPLCLALTLCGPARAHAQGLRLAWDANAEPTLAGYVIMVGTSSGIYSQSSTIGKLTTHDVPGLLPATRYFFVVKAYDTAGRLSPASSEVSASTPGTAPPTPPPPPPPPPVAALALTRVTPSRGPTYGGTTITLEGANFVTGARVYIGSSRASSVTRISPTRLQARTPSRSTGVRTIKVTNPDGQSASLANSFTYIRSSWFWLTPEEAASAQAPALREADAENILNREVSLYFAEGVVNDFFDTRFALANPGTAAASVTLTFTDTDGRVTPIGLAMPPRSRKTEVAASVTSTNGVPIVVERSM
jgi:hypothetical protein